MNVTTREAHDIKIVAFEGNLDTNTSPAAEGKLNELIKEGSKKILVNLEKLDYMSSAGLRILLVAARQLKSGGGELRICCLNETVQEVFDISGFSTIFNVFRAEPAALEGF